MSRFPEPTLSTSQFIPVWDRHKFWSVDCDGVAIGVIVLHHGRSDDPADWRWTIRLHAGRFGNSLPAKSGAAATREDAMADFRQAFQRCRDQIGDEGWALHVAHVAWVEAQSARWRRQREGTEPGGYG